MTNLGRPNAAWAGDHGEPDSIVRATLATAEGSKDPVDYARAVATLCTTRLLLPIVATGDDGGAGPDPDRHAELAAVRLTSTNGATALLVFTGLDALTAWNRTARPVPCTLDDVAATAAHTGSDAILVDLAGPHRLVIDAELIAHLAAGRRLVELNDGNWGWMFLAGDSSDPGATS